MSQVPTVNVSALYVNSTVGEDISPTIFDAAIQDIIATINENDNLVQSLVPDSPLTPVPPDFMARQALINENFDIAQRGTTFLSPASNTYTLDHWQAAFNQDGGTMPTQVNISQIPIGPGDILNTAYFCRISPNGSGTLLGMNSYYALWQKIEHATRYICGSGKKVTVSFWARSSITGKRIGVGLRQDYGTGGAPSALEDISGQTIALTPVWTKYSITFSTNTLTGKTFGTNNDDFLRLAFFHVWGSASAAALLGGGAAENFIAAGDIDIAQVQLCSGDTSLPFQPRSYAEELTLCQRYCQVIKGTNMRTPLSSLTTSVDLIISIPLKVVMRVAPTVSLSGVRGTDWNLAPIDNGGNNATGTLTAFPTGADYASIYFASGTFTSAKPYFISLATSNGAIVLDSDF